VAAGAGGRAGGAGEFGLDQRAMGASLRRSALAGACQLASAACAGADGSASPEWREPSRDGAPQAAGSEGEDELVSARAADGAVMPELDVEGYVFRMGELELVVQPAIGGRITRFSLGGRNILTGPEVVAGGDGVLPDMYGSTFWTSPQSGWGWPPEAAIDNAPYAAAVDGALLELVSEAGASTGYAVRKRFRADARRGVIDIEYVLENRRASAAAAPWEISRVPKAGFVVFPATAPALPQSTLPGTFADGLSWVQLGAAPPADSKLFQDGAEGWLAYVLDGLAFIKTFDDLEPAAAAPGEAEIEVFTNGRYDYAEIEQQGRYALPPAGGAASWRVSWRLERIPGAVERGLGSSSLVGWLREQVARMRG
jgi:hypothetical protein